MDIVASKVLTYSWLKLIDMPLFTVCRVSRMQTSNSEVYDPEESHSYGMYRRVLFRKA